MITATKQYNQELYHYGVKGMKWGVRKKRVSEQSVQRAAKKLVKFKAKEIDAKNRFWDNMFSYSDAADGLNIGTKEAKKANDSKHIKQYERRFKQADKQREYFKNKTNEYLNKMTKKFENSPYSDIKLSEHRDNGMTYVSALIGNYHTNPRDGSKHYRVTASTSVNDLFA